MVMACIIPNMDGQSGKTIQSLPDTLSSLMGFNKYLTPTWIESVSHIIKELSPAKPKMEVMVRKELSSAKPKMEVMVQKAQHDDPDDTEPEVKGATIQDEIDSLNAKLKQITLQRRQALNSYLDLKGNIRVFCRVRPFHHEESYQSRNLFTLDESNVSLKVAETKIKQYKFDKVFNQSSTQGDVFAEVEPVIKSALDGYNVCIFAYGQTGSGKTYTMEGKPTNLGVIPRGIQALFNRASESNIRFMFTFSMLEIYMGNLRDLLVPGNKSHGFKKVPSLSIKTDSDGGIEIENLVAVSVSSFQEVKRLYEVGTRLRSTASTMANSTSSRSHCLIRISLTSFNGPERKKERNKLWMIDLGGSERLVKTKATGKRLKEGKAINLSLSALGDVIDALQTKKTHVPYRNSKLTQVLRDSLGCESKTLMLVHIRPNEDDLCETICTLGFATRVRSIQLESEEPPEVKARKEHLLMEFRQEISSLEHECEDITRKIKKLEETMEHLNGPQPSISTNFAISHSSEEPRTEMSKNTKSSKNYRDVSKLPRFMKPTASSQQRIGLNKHVPASNRTKPPVTPKTKRRPSSVYAESIRLPVHTATWQSECSSECSISMTSDMNWLPSMQDDTECSQDTSECETKQAIFSEDENMLQDQVISVTECQHAEPGKVQNIAEEMGIIDIESWIHQQIIENTGISQSIRVLEIPEVTEHGTCDSRTTSPLHMEWTKDFKQGQDEDSGMNLSSPTHNIKDIKQTKAVNQIITTELRTPPSEELCRNTEIKEQKNERLAYHGSYRRSLKKIMDSCITKQLDQEAKADPSIQHEIRFQDKEHYTGNLAKFFRALRTTWIGALLGMGTMSLGLEEDFFQSLML